MISDGALDLWMVSNFDQNGSTMKSIHSGSKRIFVMKVISKCDKNGGDLTFNGQYGYSKCISWPKSRKYSFKKCYGEEYVMKSH